MAIGNAGGRFGTLKKVLSNKLINKGIFPKTSSKKLVIIMYHGIDLVQDTTYNQRFFSQANFERQIASLKKHCNVLTYDDFAQNQLSGSKLNILITFDDGYSNNYRYALPVLDKYGAHALYFITGVNTTPRKVLWADALDIVSRHTPEGTPLTVNDTRFRFKNGEFRSSEKNILLKKCVKESSAGGYGEKQQLIDQLLAIYDFTKVPCLTDYWQLMTDEEIRKTAASPNITIGSHGFYHNNLGSLSNDDALAEVVQSKAYLENITQKRVATIGFPDGSYTEHLNDSLLGAGFRHLFLVDYLYGDDGKRSYAFDRMGLYPFMGNNHEMLYKILRG